MNIRSLLSTLAAPMRPLVAACVVCVSAGPVHAQVVAPDAATPAPDVAAAPATPLRSPGAPTLTREQLSYATGVTTVRNMVKNKIEIDLDAVIRGMRDAIAGNKAVVMNDKEIRAAMNALQVELRRSDRANRREAAQTNAQRGSAYLAEFKQQDGVVALPNGVLYRELKAGSGARPAEMDQVIVNYRGTLVDGTEFDATEPDRPATLRLVNGIMGWREALKRMPAGARWQVVVPPSLAYGDRGIPGTIGPNETLVFEIELVDVKRS